MCTGELFTAFHLAVTACNQFCVLLQGGSCFYSQLQTSCSRSLCALFFFYLFCSEQQLVKSFFFPFMFLVCYLLWIVSVFVFFSQPLLQLPLNLHSCCFYVAFCLFLCIICILSPFLMLLINYSHLLIMPAPCILSSSVAEIPFYLLVFTCGF